MPLDTGSTLGSFATGSVAGYVSTLEKARLEEGKKRSDDVETLKALLSAGWKPLDPKKGSPTGEALVLQSLGQVMIPPLIDKQKEYELHLQELAERVKTRESQERISQSHERQALIKEQSDELDRLAKVANNASAKVRAQIAECMEKMRLKGAEYGLKADELRIKFEELRIKLAQEKAKEGTAEGKVTKLITITDKDGKRKTIMAVVDEKKGTFVPIKGKTGEEALPPIVTKEPTPITEMNKFQQESTVASAQNAIETNKTKRELVVGQVGIFNNHSTGSHVYRWGQVPGGWYGTNPGWQKFKLPQLADGTQITAKGLNQISGVYGTTPDEYLDRLYKNGKLAPGTVWPPKDWPGIVSAVPPVAKPSPPRPPLPIQ